LALITATAATTRATTVRARAKVRAKVRAKSKVRAKARARARATTAQGRAKLWATTGMTRIRGTGGAKGRVTATARGTSSDD
jgi:hypothetical protein